MSLNPSESRDSRHQVAGVEFQALHRAGILGQLICCGGGWYYNYYITVPKNLESNRDNEAGTQVTIIQNDMR